MKKITGEELFKAGAHIGHKRQKVHHKSKKYIHKYDRGVSIIDIYKTEELLHSAREYVTNLLKDKKTILVIGTKRQAKPILEKYLDDDNLFFLINKWIPGFLTNFSEMKKNLKNMTKMREEKESGEWKKYPKHEQVKMGKKLTRIENVYKSVENLKSLPNALFIIDAKRELNAINEARSLSIPTIAITDTNSDPSLVDYPIPANDDASSSLEIVIDSILDIYHNQKKDK